MKTEMMLVQNMIKQCRLHDQKFKMKTLTLLYCNREVRLVASTRYMMVALLGN